MGVQSVCDRLVVSSLAPDPKVEYLSQCRSICTLLLMVFYLIIPAASFDELGWVSVGCKGCERGVQSVCNGLAIPSLAPDKKKWHISVNISSFVLFFLWFSISIYPATSCDGLGWVSVGCKGLKGGVQSVCDGLAVSFSSLAPDPISGISQSFFLHL